MRPQNQNRRIVIVALCGVFLCTGAVLLFSALKQNTQFFYNPSEILAPGFAAKSDKIRIGGLVVMDSVIKGEGVLTTFKLSDFPEDGEVEGPEMSAVTVTFDDILPDLFREGQGVVVTGTMESATHMVASEVLAKHDENYQPKK